MTCPKSVAEQSIAPTVMVTHKLMPLPWYCPSQECIPLFFAICNVSVIQNNVTLSAERGS